MVRALGCGGWKLSRKVSCRNDGCASGIHPEDVGDGVQDDHRFAAWILPLRGF